MNNEIRMTKADDAFVRHSGFGFDSSFWFRHLDFAVPPAPSLTTPRPLTPLSLYAPQNRPTSRAIASLPGALGNRISILTRPVISGG
jgi:hypothetical protein